MSKWKYFKYDDFKCKHCDANQMDENVIDQLDAMREECGFPFIINSGYRCPEHNAAVSKTGLNGPHTTGKAVDIRVTSGRQRWMIMYSALIRGLTRFGIAKTFVHIDWTRETDQKVVWTY